MVLQMLNCFHSPQQTASTDDTEEAPIECNYDKDVTYLYQAIEEKAFMAAIDFLESSNKEDVHEQCRTWVTRYEKETEEIRWSQLPLHAALIFKAPLKVIDLLVKQYKLAVRCTDDQKMLPLHLAFRYGASDNVIHLLLKEFPEAMNAKDHKDRFPLDFSKLGDGWKKGEIIELFMVNAASIAQKKIVSKELEELNKKLQEETTKTKELQSANDGLQAQNKLLLELNQAKNAAPAVVAPAPAPAPSPLVKTLSLLSNKSKSPKAVVATPAPAPTPKATTPAATVTTTAPTTTPTTSVTKATTPAAVTTTPTKKAVVKDQTKKKRGFFGLFKKTTVTKKTTTVTKTTTKTTPVVVKKEPLTPTESESSKEVPVVQQQ